MRAAHERSRQSARARAHLAPVALLATVLAGCRATDLAPSIWPPPDFQCEIEELELRGGELQVLRRMRFDVDGLVVYGTASRSHSAPGADVALPVFDRLAVYQLVPASIRRFARRLDQLGVARLDSAQGERGATDDTGLVLRWRAFGTRKTLTARGRVHGPMAEILEVVAAHMPPGERFALPEFPAQPVVPVLRGVPEPLADATKSLEVHLELLDRDPGEASWLLDAFALACATGARQTAEELLDRWAEAARPARPLHPFPDETEAALDADSLRQLLPPR